MTTNKIAIDVRVIEHGSTDYEREVELRDRILRRPLGLAFSADDLAREKKDHHLGAYIGDQLVGCLMLVEIRPRILKMRQVAVDDAHQKKGIGEALVTAAEDFARQLEATEIELNARDAAVGFYVKLGYQTVGEPFVEVSIRHLKMIKKLT